ncbi:MAG: bifunctional folylpolyglutamate synthase/dihydrofolate synthase [Bacteroidota bacterium]
MLNNYSEAIAWLFQQFPSYQNIGASAYKPGLANTQHLLQNLGNPETKLRFIHVAGTNGKGSTCAFTASFLQQKGYRVGLFTSPHLVDFRERIRVNGQTIPEDKVLDFCNKVVQFNVDLSFFEITLGMALVHFEQERCDYVVLETGMGGRLDATNVVTPLVSVITNIGLDHQAFLGNSLPEIAGEKAGIIKQGVPVICGEERPELQEVFSSKAANLNAPIQFQHGDVKATCEELPLFQRNNAALALEVLSALAISTDTLDPVDTWNHLFVATGFLGRLTPSMKFSKLYYDASHNAAGLEATLKTLNWMGKDNIMVVFGASNDKALEHLSKSAVKQWVFCEFSNDRSYRGQHLQETVEKLSLTEVHYAADVNQGIEKALEMRQEDSTILVTGSFFLLSDCREIRERLLQGDQ